MAPQLPVVNIFKFESGLKHFPTVIWLMAFAIQVITRVGDLVGIKYFPAEPIKQKQDESLKKLH